MKFNSEKCKMMQIGNKNPGTMYVMGDKALTETKEEKDLGVIMCQNLKIEKQCGQAAKKVIRYWV